PRNAPNICSFLWVMIYTEAEVADLPALVIKHIREENPRSPDIAARDYCVLKAGPRSRKIAYYLGIVDRHTGEFHHDSLQIKTLRKRVGGWQFDVVHSVTLTDEQEDEIARLLTFLATVKGGSIPAETGDFLAVPVPQEADAEAIRHLFG